MTVEEYLAFETASEARHEFLDGHVYERPGASVRHSTICVNILTELRVGLRGSGCRPRSSDLKVRVGAAYFYPDVSVICGPAVLYEGRDDVIVNPILLGEVLSKSTEDFDRGGKFARYRQIDSLKTYLTVAQDRPEVVLHERQENRWVLTEFTDLADAVELASLGISLPLAEIYEDVTFPEAVIIDF